MHLWILVIVCLLSLVYAGPGTHRYQSTHSSNYGDEKHNREHIQEHLEAMKKDGDIELSEQDTIYYLFVIHDLNGDGYLDGHELRIAFTDFDQHEADTTMTLKEVTAMIDHVLEEDDKNGDGLISWTEYLESQLYHED
ncbi:uncharacterized protein B0P05DRAFT_563842 [Gilbertella persicaria]|uniref:uncharacterized protein n=1 Tax=Gilbertella persicaria TaxID=101096 RepID=UPI0022202E25|nr:uncharacterized protein B0P05DRAFT_563842 [Gilbertella persicaria]KAI8049131.1 hypothetical protein B0P05DRAFT_563842 [Gilbertella persicaria]